MDLWDVDALTDTASEPTSRPELAALELMAQAMFSVDEARQRVFRGRGDEA
jgi:hypothetical protein